MILYLKILSNNKKNSSVYGVISSKLNNNQIIVNSLGEGGIWITNTNGNLNNGDYIQTSDIEGLGEKQDNNILYNYTIAKILHDCNFDINNNNYNTIKYFDINSNKYYLKSFVACSYHCS